ncbi:RCC1 domain-containing protein [Ilumatobacter coccineus]|nr:fibronectin type III domain-containing protein [Ilumatobacter coccineus]
MVGVPSPPAAADVAGAEPGSPRGAAAVIAAGREHTCAIDETAAVRCWGANGDGQLGLGDSVNRGDDPGEMGGALEAVDFGPGRTATAITAGAAHTCALLDNHTTKCWGNGFDGRLGNNATTNIGDGTGPTIAASPPIDFGPGRTATAITTGSAHTCALLDDHTTKCWGYGFYGRLGNNATTNIGDGTGPTIAASPPIDFGPGRTATAITTGSAHTCALLDNHTTKCWGYGFYGQLGNNATTNIGDGTGPTIAASPPIDLGPGRTATAITAGAAHTCALLDDHTTKCWGYGSDGQLGNNATTNIGDGTGPTIAASPPIDLGPGRTATAITASGFHTCALLDNHTTKCWGYGFSGQLGNNATTNIGDGTGPTIAASPPIDLGPGRTATAITAGEFHTCALLDDHTTKCWGNGFDGQLGNNATTNIGDGIGLSVAASDPVDLGQVVGVDAPPVTTQIATGGAHTCAILDDHTTKCWGNGFDGQLGNNATTTIGDGTGPTIAASPPIDFGPGRTATAITTSSAHTCALLDNHTTKCWGNGFDGRLGNNATTTIGDGTGPTIAASPPIDLGPGRTATAITTSSAHTCGLLDNHTTKCWGDGGFGRLGNNATTNIGDGTGPTIAASPPIDLGPGRTATAITAGEFHTCALLDDHTTKCWGYGFDGQLGNNATTNIGDGTGPTIAASPPIDLGPGRTATAITTGRFHTCALLDNHTTKCWGDGAYGQLGNNATTNIGDGTGPTIAASPPIDLGPGRTATAITTGSFHTCALLDDHTTKCWGSGFEGRLGNNATTNIGDGTGPTIAASPPIDLGPGRTATAITAGVFHTCALLDDHTTKCWGRGFFGRLGNNATTNIGDGPTRSVADSAPVPIGGHTSRSLDAGSEHTCVVLEDGGVACWGAAGSGRLGIGGVDDVGDDPAEVSGGFTRVDLGSGVTADAVAGGSAHTCVLLSDGTVKCFGSGGNGQLGNDATSNIGDGGVSVAGSSPVVLGAAAREVAVGGSHSCALLDNASLKCWGANGAGQLGQNDAASRGDSTGDMAALAPIQLGSGLTALTVTAGENHTCALLDDLAVKCWGANADGQLGQGDTDARGDAGGEMGDSLLAVSLGTDRVAVAVAAGANHTCALLDNRDVKCWGNNGAGQLGQGDTDARGDNGGEMGDSLLAVPLGQKATAIAAGSFHTCALLVDHSVVCWGGGANGRLGHGGGDNVGDSPGEVAAQIPVDLGAGRRAVAITAGDAHTCALLDDQTVKCWGDGDNGRIGQGDTVDLGDGPGELGDDLPPIRISADTRVLSVAAPPAAPTAVTPAYNPTSSDIALSWTDPGDDGGAAITGYIVQTSTDASTWTTRATTASATTSENIAGLTPGVPQRFRVAAVNGVGQGPWSMSSELFVPSEPPTVIIAAAAAQSDPTNADSVDFTVTFDTAVTGFTADDIILDGTAGAAIAAVSGSGATYTVTVSGMSSDGTITAEVRPLAALTSNGQVNPLGSNVASISRDATGPVATVALESGQAATTSDLPVEFSITFDENVTGFTSDDLAVGGTAGATTGTVTGSGATYTAAIADVTGSGTVTLTVEPGAVTDALGNSSTTIVTTGTVTYDATPVVSSLSPSRFVDTRPSGTTLDGQFEAAGKRDAGSEYTVQITGRGDVPDGAEAVIINVTAIFPESVGYVTVHPCVTPLPTASSLNYTAGVNLGNEIIAPLSATGTICLFTSAASHLAVDVTGYVANGSPVTPITPGRFLDTRPSGTTIDDTAVGGTKPAAGSTTTIPIAGRGDVPTDAAAVIVNITAIGAEGTGYITAHPCLDTPPNAASLNYVAGTNRGNELIATLDESGDLCLFTSTTTHLSADVVGYLPAGTTVTPNGPARLLDTRPSGVTIDSEHQAIGKRTADDEYTLQISGRSNVPTDATAAVLNITAIAPESTGFVTVHPCEPTLPTASSLNHITGVNGGNEIIARLSSAGTICLYTSSNTHLTVDIVAHIT